MAFQSVKGFKDILPLDAERTTRLETVAREVLERFGFRELRLPTLETRELFVKSTGETTDIVEKEMFVLEDQGGRHLALRPEGTPGTVRAYLENALAQQGGRTKLFYMGSMFRAERPQKGRYREFEQIGAECFGNGHPAADVEGIHALATIFDAAGLKGKYSVAINNLGDENPDCRPAYRAALLAFFETIKDQLCEHCRARMSRNPLRVLDCKGDGPKLKANPNLPTLKPCAPCRAHFEQVTALLSAMELNVQFDSSLVRGLDYYTRTVFEFRSSAVGSQDALAGGGRYDGLIKSMDGPDTPAFGWALGVERTLLALSAYDQPPIDENSLVYVAVQTDKTEVQTAAMTLLHHLRLFSCYELPGARMMHPAISKVFVTRPIEVSIRAEGALFGHSLKAQMREADRLKARYVVIFGDDEFAKGQCVIKDMRFKDSQEAVSISAALETLIQKLGAHTND